MRHAIMRAARGDGESRLLERREEFSSAGGVAGAAPATGRRASGLEIAVGIMRRLLRQIAAGEKEIKGDTSTLEDRSVVERLKEGA